MVTLGRRVCCVIQEKGSTEYILIAVHDRSHEASKPKECTLFNIENKHWELHMTSPRLYVIKKKNKETVQQPLMKWRPLQ